MNAIPLDRGFNVAVMQIASRLLPAGYDVGPKAPDTLPKLRAHVARTGRMLVWNGCSDQTIFADEEVNWAFRAWHDWCHLAGNHDFDDAGERAAAAMQIGHLRMLFAGHESLPKWERLVWIEVVGQAEHLKRTGAFPADQRAFTVRALAAPSYALDSLARSGLQAA